MCACLMTKYAELFFNLFFSSRRRHTRSTRDWSSDVCSSDIIAAVEPHHQTRMAAQSVNLVTQRLLGDLKVCRLPPWPALPEIAAAPSGHHENSLLVRQVEKLLRFQLAFQADRVKSHVPNIAKFIPQPLRVLAQHHIGRPAAAAQQDVLAIDMEGAP